MSRPPRIVEAEHLGDLRLRITFSDGLVRELDFDGVVGTGVLKPLTNPTVFAQVAVDPVAGTVTWPNGVDLDPACSMVTTTPRLVPGRSCSPSTSSGRPAETARGTHSAQPSPRPLFRNC
jgi:hypothetical protein